MGEESKGVSEEEKGANTEVKEKYDKNQRKQNLNFLMVLNSFHVVTLY